MDGISSSSCDLFRSSRWRRRMSIGLVSLTGGLIDGVARVIDACVPGSASQGVKCSLQVEAVLAKIVEDLSDEGIQYPGVVAIASGTACCQVKLLRSFHSGDSFDSSLTNSPRTADRSVGNL
jgi:hypothetical protein